MPLKPRKRWEMSPPVPPDHLAHFPHLSPLIVQLLYNRGVIRPSEVEAFLSGEGVVANPFRLKGMSEAVDRLRRAIRREELIVVYGDFDADGVTATALLVQALRSLGAQVRPYIPHRVEEGYGLNIRALRKLAREGARVVVTVDCGIRSVKEVSYGRRLGLDIIVTDHHSPGPELPPAVAAINPKRRDCPYPFKELSGVGVAYKLAQALFQVERQVPLRKSISSFREEELLDLVALGTVADLVPLLEENRWLVRKGLELLNAPARLGIRALMEKAGLRPGRVDSHAISYILGPRLNAAGRLASAMTSYELLMTQEPQEAEALAQELDERNRERQRLTQEALVLAREQVLREPEAPILFVSSPDFLPGILGLVASKLCEEFYRPVLALSLGEKRSRGSARSIPEFHITAALDECADLLITYGGHAAAAGLTVENANLEALRERLRDIARKRLEGVELVPTLTIDAEIPLSDASWKTLALLEELQPFGYGNPPPLLLSRGVQVREARAVGGVRPSVGEEGAPPTQEGGRHLKLLLSDGRIVWDAIAFNRGELADSLPRRVDVVYTLQVNEWNNERQLRLVIEDMRASE